MQIKENDSSHRLRQLVQVLWHHTFEDRLTIGDLIFVELARWEISDQRVHSILHRQHLFRVARDEQSFKQTPRVVCFLCIFTEGRRWQLVLITDEDHPLRIQFEGYQTRELRALASLIYDQVIDAVFADLKLVYASG